MRNSLQRWLDALPIADPIVRRLAPAYQLVLILWIVLAIVGIPANSLSSAPTPGTPAPVLPPIVMQLMLLLGAAGMLLFVVPIIALVLLRRGRFGLSVGVASLGLLAAHSFAAYVLGVTNGSVLVVYQVPIALAGLLGRRRLLPIVAGISIAGVTLVGVLESMTPPMAGFFAAAMASTSEASGAPSMIGMQVGFFSATTLLVAVLIDRFGKAFRETLASAHAREQELQSLSVTLEQTVAERTGALQESLRESEARAAEQAKLLATVEQQQLTIQDLAVPVIPLSADTLVIPLIGTLDGERLQDLQTQSLRALEQRGAQTLILDITGVPVVDTQVAQGFVMTMQSARLLGASVLLVGIRPEVAQTIVGLGIDLQGVRTFSDLQSALASLSDAGAPRAERRALTAA
jgi:rsbT co-antagonist protein RsbR